jgi:hypothetical protein
MNAVLVYNGTPIHDRGEMLCLTDMWRAAGSDPSKQPSRWRKLPGSGEFIDHIAAAGRFSPSELFQVSLGAATWAHWQIAFAYAKYLSPEFHAWCNEVVRAHMEGRTPPPLRRDDDPLQQMINAAVTKAVTQAMLPFGGQLNRIERKQDDLAIKITSKRKSLSSAEERILDRYALSSGRLCGCCRRRFVVDPDGNRLPTAATDHAYTNQLANVNARSVTCWLVCSSPNGEPRTNEYCHDKLTSGEMPREMAAHRFNAYADLVREFIATENGPPLIARAEQPLQPPAPQQERLPLLLPEEFTRADRICSAIYFTHGNAATIAEIGACGIATHGQDALASVRNGILRQLEGSTEHTKPPWNAKPTLFRLADPAMKGRLGVRYSCTEIGIETAIRVGPLPLLPFAAVSS